MAPTNTQTRIRLSRIFAVFAVIPFVLWVYDHLSSSDGGILGQWSMLMVTVFFTSMFLIVRDETMGKNLARGISGAIVSVFRARGGAPKKKDPAEEDLPPS